MRTALAIIAVLGTVCGVNPRPQSLTLDQLRWMAGCWEAASANRLIQEQWMPPGGGSMFGMSRTIRRDTTVAHEFMQIIERSGKLVLIAHPSGQASTEFVLSYSRKDSVAFANPDHDFPQRILYRRVGADSLVARIEGRRAGQVRGIDFPYVRVRCP